MVRRVGAARRIASAAARRSPRTSVRSDGLDGDVGAGAHGEAEVGLGQRGGVVDAVADHRDDAAFGLQAADDVGLVGGQDLGDDLVDADLGGDRAGGRLVVAGEQDGAQPERRAARRRLRALVGLTVSATTKHGARLRRPSRRRPRCCPRASARGAAASSSGGRCIAQSASSARAAGDDVRGRRRRPRRRGPRGWRSPRPRAAARAAAAPAAMARAIGCSEASSSGADEAQRLVARRRRRRRRRRRALILPVVTVPVLSSTIVSTRRVDSSTSGPLMRMPSWAPRPVPTSRAVGVARPSAHGQAMMSTATAAVNATVGALAGAEPEAERGDGEAEHDRHEDARDAVGEALHRRLAGLRLRRPAGRSAPARCRRRPGWRGRRGGRRR